MRGAGGHVGGISRLARERRHLRHRPARDDGDLTLVGSTKRVILTVTDSRCDVATEYESARCRAVAELLVNAPETPTTLPAKHCGSLAISQAP